MTRSTRHGFSTCAECFAHVRIEADKPNGDCPFCGAMLGQRAAKIPPSALQRVIKAGRSGLIAATVLGLSTAPACAPDGNPPTGDAAPSDTMMDTGPDILQQPYGLPPDIMVGPDAGAADAGAADAEAADAEATEIGPAPPYGIPADAQP